MKKSFTLTLRILFVFFNLLFSKLALADVVQLPQEESICAQKYGVEIDLHDVTLAKHAPQILEKLTASFDSECPKWPVLAARIAAFGSIQDLKKMLSEGLNPDSEFKLGHKTLTILSFAIAHRRIDSAQLLLSAGASAKIGYPILYSIYTYKTNNMYEDRNNNQEMLSLLLNYGANPNSPCINSMHSRSIIERSIGLRDIKFVEMLLEAGAKPDGELCKDTFDFLTFLTPINFGMWYLAENSKNEPRIIINKEKAEILNRIKEIQVSSALTFAINGASYGDITSREPTASWMMHNYNEFWKEEVGEITKTYRRIAVKLVQNGAVFSSTAIASDTDIYLLSIMIAASRLAGYEVEFLDKQINRVSEYTQKKEKHEKALSYLLMLKNCTHKIMEAKDDHFRLCASEPE